MEKIKKLWQNEYFKTAISMLLVILLFLIFWYGSIAYFNTESPYLVVSSGSMRPTLEVGDLIIVKRIPLLQLNAAPMNGDIIVYKKPNGDLVVHRLVNKTKIDDKYILTTKGDANTASDPSFPDQRYIGKVVARIPFIGHISLFTNTTEGFYFFLFIMICLIVIFIAFPSDKETAKEGREDAYKKSKEGEILHKILNLNFFVFLIVNLLITGFLLFSLWGSFSFWQPGAERDFQWVTIRGMYPDIEFHKNFIKPHLPKVKETILRLGFFTYEIDCRMDNGEIRTGVPTFSWAQFSILILILVNVWVITKFLLSKRRLSHKAEQ